MKTKIKTASEIIIMITIMWAIVLVFVILPVVITAIILHNLGLI